MSALPPLLFTAAGPQPTPPAQLNAALIALVASTNPGYTILPAGLIEDLASTGTGILVTIDQARVDEVNNVSPGSANPYVLAQLGAQFGIPQGLPTNGSVYVVFTGSPGFVITPGWTMSDGTNQYVTYDGGVIGSGGTSSLLLFIATNSNVFAIPANTVTTIVTSIPSPYTLTATNPNPGTLATGAQTVESYQSQMLQSWNSPISGWQTFLKTLLQAVLGVNSRLVSVILNGSNWEVIVGGGDTYQVAYAIYQAVSNIGLLTGSSINSDRNVTASIYDAPDTYSVVFVEAQAQEVTLAISWNTTLANFTSGLIFNQLAIAAASAYLNGIIVGQPININVLTSVVQQATASVLATTNLTTLSFVVKYNGTTQNPTAGTQIIPAPDVETYLYALAADVTCAQA